MPRYQVGWLASLKLRLGLWLCERRMRLVESQLDQERALHDQMLVDLTREFNDLVGKRAALLIANRYHVRHQLRRGASHV